MTISEIAPNASLPPPSIAECKEFLARAREALAFAWDNPGKLGEDSAICRAASSLLSEIRQYCTPQSSTDGEQHEARTTFLEALRLAWLAVWRARDYSAGGFQRRSIAANWTYEVTLGPAGNNRVSYGGVSWFSLHAPLWGPDGKPTGFSALNYDRRAQFEHNPAFWEGAMIRPETPWDLASMRQFRWCAFETSVPADGGGFGATDSLFVGAGQSPNYGNRAVSSFVNTIALVPVSLSDFRMNGIASRIEGARFEEGLRINGHCLDEVTIADVETGASLTCDNLRIDGGLKLTRSLGVRAIRADHVTLLGDLELRADHPFALTIGGATPSKIGSLRASKVPFSELRLLKVDIARELSLQSSACETAPCLDEVVVTGKANLDGFEVRPSSVSAQFTRCIFKSEVSFVAAQFYGPANFDGTTFERDAAFSAAVFWNEARFVDTGFMGHTSFAAGLFPPVQFRGDAIFAAKDVSARTSQFHWLSFEDARFDGQAIFRNRKFNDDTSFNGAHFRRPPSFHGAKLHPKTSFADASFDWLKFRPSKWWQRLFLARWQAWRRRGPHHSMREDASYVLNGADSFRVLSALAKEIQAPALSYEFHAQELRARQHSGLNAGVPRLEAIVSRLYGWVSGYGSSLARPIGLWLASIAISGGIYWMMLPPNLRKDDAATSIAVVMHLKPLAAFETTFGRIDSPSARAVCNEQFRGTVQLSLQCAAEDLVNNHGSAVRWMSVGQSLISIVSVFLLALALRRRFQLN